MALIKCPECGKEISDKSEKCIHCGFPIRNTPYIQEIINGKSYDVSFLIDRSMTQIQKIQKLNTMTGCGLPIAKNIVLKYHPTQSSTPTQNVPHCPTCGSTNIQKISDTKRWLTTGLFGLASSDVGKTMVCKKCGYKF